MSEKKKRLLAKSIYSTVQQKSLENMIKRELVLNYGYDNKVAIAESLAARIMQIFEDYAPDREKIKPFQVLWVGVDQYDEPGHGKTLAQTAQKTIIVDLWTKEELDQLSNGIKSSSLLPQRVARITKQALKQEAVLIQTDLSLMLGVSVASIRKAIDQWQKQYNEILPLRGTVHDMGMTFSHKRLIIELHLKGLFTSEIARISNHDPGNVDRYIDDFERVLEFAKENAPVYKISFFTGMSERLVKEYLNIVKEHCLSDYKPIE
ncbi:MAG: DUF1670 domain-containing protein [Candidatus Helarchaeota archaeon]